MTTASRPPVSQSSDAVDTAPSAGPVSKVLEPVATDGQLVLIAEASGVASANQPEPVSTPDPAPNRRQQPTRNP